MNLFEAKQESELKKSAPLADRMRPRTLDEYIGQSKIIGPGRLLRRAIQIDRLSSLIFYGPPGTGKTTLARIIANTTKAHFITLNAVLSGVKEIRVAVEIAKEKLSYHSIKTILFIDEVHRFNKSQQDALLPYVENGTVIFIGATTENPYFEVNKALVSRSRIFQLEPLEENELKQVALQAISDPERGYGKLNVRITDEALQHLTSVANGDARAVLNALELAVETTDPVDGTITLTQNIIEDSIQQKAVLYDKDGDTHYDTISAFIKSIRGSDPDAALYWMAKMIYAGEDPRFIFRRMIILAAEDIGLADPNALTVVMSAAQAYDYIGLPEGQFPLSQACIYLATAPKSNTTLSFFDAMNSVQTEKIDDVPNHLKDKSRDGKEFGHGDGYLYPHSYRDHWIEQQYLPNNVAGKTFYTPSKEGYEKSIFETVTKRKELQLELIMELSTKNIIGEKTNMTPPDFWQEAASGDLKKMFADIREIIFSQLSNIKDSLFLEMSNGGGFLLFEAIRRIRNISPWCQVSSSAERETILNHLKTTDRFNEPEIVVTKPDKMVDKIKSVAGENVRFDIITGRNILYSIKNNPKTLLNISNIISENGCLIFAETDFANSTKLSDITLGNNKHLNNMLKQAEDEFFQLPQMKIDINSTKNFLEKSNFSITIVKQIKYNILKRFSKSSVEDWFSSEKLSDENSLGYALKKHVDLSELTKIKNNIIQTLCSFPTDWQYSVLFIKINPLPKHTREK